MFSFLRIRSQVLALAVLAVVSGPALAEKPEWAGGGKGKQHQEGGKQVQRGGGRQQDVRPGSHFTEQHRAAAHGYYVQAQQGGKRCPPGLAKKNNGCMPPGLAKKYHLGQPLPAGVVVYPVPQAVVVQLPPAPAGHKYVRVATDILLIAIGSQMVVDAITDLTRL